MKEKKTINKNDFTKNQKTLSAKLSVSTDAIAVTAYYLWEKKGKPNNSDLENWLEAEKKLIK